MPAPLRIASDVLAVDVRPDKGADITAVIDVASGIDVLFHAPWGAPELASAPTTGDSHVDWLARYGGGWQQLVPNAGPERVVDGVRRGFHGEAAVVGWEVSSADPTRAAMSVDLVTAPLHLTRQLDVGGPTLQVTDTVTNTGTVALPVMWVQHPGFGAAFADEHTTLTTGARSFLADAEHPGTALAADRKAAFPHGISAADPTVTLDLSSIPGPHSGRAVFGCLLEFTDAWFALDSPTAGFGIRFDWDVRTFPYAWFWQECHASPGFPWYQQAYVVAVEPANVIPGVPAPGCPERGDTPLLAAAQTWTSVVRLTRTALG